MPHSEFIKEVFKPFGCEKTVHIWQKDEQNKFIEAVRTHGRDWEKICEALGTHSKSLVQAYARIFLKQVEEDPSMAGSDIAEILKAEDSKEHVPLISAMTTAECESQDVEPKTPDE